jgi:hypothetical protein
MARRATAALVLAASAGLLTGAGPALAGTVHEVQTAPSPSTGEPIAGGGTWLVNTPSGYYLGRTLPGQHFDNEVTSAAGWHFGRGPLFCAWALPGSLGADAGTTADSCGDRSAMAHRLTVGRDFNAAAHAATDGTEVPASPDCTFHLNYLQGDDFATNGGHWADPAGHPGSTVRYRFTTRDGGAAVVRDEALGWGFLPVDCVQRPTDLYNDND